MTYPKKLIVGLGNPGEKYAETRHNVGFDWVDFLIANNGVQFKSFSKFRADVAQLEFDFGSVFVIKPLTYMNDSGAAVGLFANYYKIKSNEMIVVHDELDLDPGGIVLKHSMGHGGHNGVRSIINHLGGNNFDRLRIGIGHPKDKSVVANYVLTKPRNDEKELIKHVIEESLAKVYLLLTGPIDKVMNEVNRR